jgi:single-strand DNA-binding protein
MKYLNSLTTLKGRIGRKPFYGDATDERQAYIKLSIATNDYSYQDDKGDWHDEVSWHNAVAWGKTAEAIRQQVEGGRLDKGALVEVIGQYRNNNYSDLQGNARYEMACHIGRFNVLKEPPGKS